MARERRLELSDGDIDAKVALRIAGLDVRRPARPQAFGHRAAGHRAGDSIALLGVNGAGKSTLLSALADAFGSRARALRQPLAGALQPGLPLVYFDQSMRDCARHVDLDYVLEVPASAKSTPSASSRSRLSFAKTPEPIAS